MRGGCLADFHLNSNSSDYDFYIGTEIEKFTDLVCKPLGLSLKKYGPWVPQEVRYVINASHNFDLFFSPNLTDFERFFHEKHTHIRAPFSINTPLYDFLNKKLHDPYQALLDIEQNRLTVFTEDTKKISPDFLESNLRFYSTHLVYKFPHFAIDPKFLNLLHDYNKNNPGKNEYLVRFPWRVESAVLKLFFASFQSFKATLDFWEKVDMLSLFLPDFQHFKSHELVKLIDGTPHFFERLNALSEGELGKRILLAKIPEEFLKKDPKYKQIYDQIEVQAGI